MKYSYVVIFLGSLLLSSCNQKTAAVPMEAMATMDSAKQENSFKNLAFDEKKDVVCGMPVSAGISDTLTYENKLYGFCSPECKDAFLQDPKQFIAVKKSLLSD